MPNAVAKKTSRHRSKANDVTANLQSEGILNLILEEEALNEHQSTRVNAVKRPTVVGTHFDIESHRSILECIAAIELLKQARSLSTRNREAIDGAFHSF